MDNWELYYQKSVIGAWLGNYLDEKKISKTQFCKECGLSRPTLDKLLAGLITNSTTYTKHILKILDYLKMTPEKFLDLISRGHRNNMNSVRSALKIDIQSMSNVTGIPISRLKKIESGMETFSQRELTDCALACNVDQNAILGNSIFAIQTGLPSFQVRDIELDGHFSGMWGCLCIKSHELERNLKYWITDQVVDRAMRDSRNKYMVVPCLNNKLLLINTDNIDEMRFMDFDGDYYDCEPDEFDGEILPPQLFRALDDYYNSMHGKGDTLSEKAQAVCKEAIKRYNITDDMVINFSNVIDVYYKGKKRDSYYVDDSDDLFNDVEAIYNMDVDDLDSQFIEIEDAEGSYDLININNVVCIEMPLNMIEDEILKI